MSLKNRQKQIISLSILLLLSILFSLYLMWQSAQTIQELPASLESLHQQEFLQWSILEPTSIEIEKILQKESVRLEYQAGNAIWQLSNMPENNSQATIERLLQNLFYLPIQPLSILEEIEINFYPEIIITLSNNGQSEQLIIAQATATHNHFYAWLTSRPTELFLINRFSSEIFNEPLSSYFNILLPTFHPDQIASFQLVNQYGEINFHFSPNPLFFSLYRFNKPFAGFSIDQQRLGEVINRIWLNRTPVNVIQSYQPNISMDNLAQHGLLPAQATLNIIHRDGSEFHLSIGYPADNFHFYAREPHSQSIWHLPSDLALSLLLLHPFNIVSRSLTLFHIENIQQVTFYRGHEPTRLLQMNNFRLHNQRSIARHTFQEYYFQLLRLRYSNMASSDFSPSTAPAYQIIWQLDNSIISYRFYPYQNHFYYVTINDNLTQLLIDRAQLEELWQILRA